MPTGSGVRSAFVFVLALSTSAHAQTAELSVERAPVPHLAGMVKGAGTRVTGEVRLTWDGESVRAQTVTPYREGREPLAIVILLQTSEMFTGNTSFERDPQIKTDGVLLAMQKELAQLHLAELVPPGSTIEVVTYANSAAVKVASEPIGAFRPDQLGSEREYRGSIGSELERGIELGIRELEASPLPLRLLYVIGDGNDTNNDRAAQELVTLRKRAEAHQILLGAAIWKSQISSDDDIVKFLVADAGKFVNGHDIVRALYRSVEQAADRTYVTFEAGLPWDGDDHAFVVTIDGRALPAVTIAMPDLRPPRSRAWWLLAIGVLALGLGVIRLRR